MINFTDLSHHSYIMFLFPQQVWDRLCLSRPDYAGQFYKDTIIQLQLCNQRIKHRTKDNGTKGEIRRQNRWWTAACGVSLYLLFQLLPELKSQKYNKLYSNRLPDWFPDFQTQFMFIHKFLSSFGLNSSDVSECSDLVLLVLSAAFDIVDHKILIRKQWAGTLDWFCLFLFQSIS